MDRPVRLGDVSKGACAVVPAHAVQAVGFEEPGLGDGPRCGWRRTSFDAKTLEIVLYPDRDILREVYASGKQVGPEFIPMMKADLPAVVEAPDGVHCTLTIGLSDRQGIQLTTTKLSRDGDNCSTVLEVAEALVVTLRGR
ncbi:hypothetical protein Acsp05_70030 [Actinokineospora sp. NBRC 105648]|nr:hypothetical protein Acsp05_70030 [Actinokineospora sp. NBRC 105648]